MHPNKHIREALKYAAEIGWEFAKSRGHAFGRIRCGHGHGDCEMWIWSTPRNPELHARRIRKTVDACPGATIYMTPEFYLILHETDLDDALADAVYKAGFDDSSLVVRGNHAAIWITDRRGELTELVREALNQASNGGLEVLHVEIKREAFARAQ